MTILAPEEEWELAHFRSDFQSLCRILFFFSLSCTLVAIYFSALPKGPLKGENEWWDLNHTKWLVKNAHFRYFENGTVYWKNPESGEIYIAYDQNYMKMSIAGYDPYYFGSTHENFCFEREEIPKSEWTGSLFRGMMLDASIMTLFRTCFLISMVPRVLYRWIISKKSYLEKKKFARAFIGVLVFINELFYYIAFYFFTMFQIWNDSMLEVTYSRTWFLMAFISLVNKLSINGVLRICLLRDRRIQWCIICVTIMCYPVIAYDMDSYQKDQYCDAMVHPLITLAQLVFVGIICMNSWVELRHSKDYIILTSTEKEKHLFNAFEKGTDAAHYVKPHVLSDLPLKQVKIVRENLDKAVEFLNTHLYRIVAGVVSFVALLVVLGLLIYYGKMQECYRWLTGK